MLEFKQLINKADKIQSEGETLIESLFNVCYNEAERDLKKTHGKNTGQFIRDKIYRCKYYLKKNKGNEIEHVSQEDLNNYATAMIYRRMIIKFLKAYDWTNPDVIEFVNYLNKLKIKLNKAIGINKTNINNSSLKNQMEIIEKANPSLKKINFNQVCSYVRLKRKLLKLGIVEKNEEELSEDDESETE